MGELEITAVGLIGLGAIIGFSRGLRQLEREVLFLLIAPGLAALLCYMISQTKTGSNLAGLFGFIAAIVMLLVLGGLVLGGVAALIWRSARAVTPGPVGEVEKWLDRLVIYGLSAAAIIVSLMETGGSGVGHH